MGGEAPQRRPHTAGPGVIRPERKPFFTGYLPEGTRGGKVLICCRACEESGSRMSRAWVSGEHLEPSSWGAYTVNLCVIHHEDERLIIDTDERYHPAFYGGEPHEAYLWWLLIDLFLTAEHALSLFSAWLEADRTRPTLDKDTVQAFTDSFYGVYEDLGAFAEEYFEGYDFPLDDKASAYVDWDAVWYHMLSQDFWDLPLPWNEEASALFRSYY